MSNVINVPETIRAIQRIEGLLVDGVAGINTWGAIAQKYGITLQTAKPETGKIEPPKGVAWKPDTRSQANIATLLPVVQPIARELLERLNAIIPLGCVKIISGNRTYAEQNDLYEQGRTKDGRIVTNCRGGYSNHNFGVAFDIAVFDGAGGYVPESHFYDDAGKIGKSLGLFWGGDWEGFEDKPHFEWRPGWARHYTENAFIRELRERKEKGIALA